MVLIQKRLPLHSALHVLIKASCVQSHAVRQAQQDIPVAYVPAFAEKCAKRAVSNRSKASAPCRAAHRAASNAGRLDVG